MASRRFSTSYLPSDVRDDLNRDMFAPFLGGRPVMSRAELNVRMMQYMNERGYWDGVPKPDMSGMSLNEKSLFKGPAPAYFNETIFVPQSGHPQYKTAPYRPDASMRTCRTPQGPCY